jgi:hypothetical protein
MNSIFVNERIDLPKIWSTSALGYLCQFGIVCEFDAPTHSKFVDIDRRIGCEEYADKLFLQVPHTLTIACTNKALKTISLCSA